MSKATFGAIEAKELGYSEPWIFRWMSATDGEISGFVENSAGGIIKNSHGWYRTNDPKKAATIALYNARYTHRSDLNAT